MRSKVTLIGIAALVGTASVASAQLRGMPTAFEPTEGYATRLGADVGGGGELGGRVVALSGSVLRPPQQSRSARGRRLALDAALGIWRKGGRSEFIAGIGAQVTVFKSPSGFTTRAMAGASRVSLDSSSRKSTEAGVGALVPVYSGGVHFDLWATPRLVYRENLATGEWEWVFRGSIGTTVAIIPAAHVGLRVGVDCGKGGTSVMGGLAYWL